ncbi:hypothetical protein SY88_03435 [Clostridiales bacterium PH28_bin88]|nr:hypothetical protein SY88_03435 [Clostridiales bacterium PH28_bin88]
MPGSISSIESLIQLIRETPTGCQVSRAQALEAVAGEVAEASVKPWAWRHVQSVYWKKYKICWQ